MAKRLRSALLRATGLVHTHLWISHVGLNRIQWRIAFDTRNPARSVNQHPIKQLASNGLLIVLPSYLEANDFDHGRCLDDLFELPSRIQLKYNTSHDVND